MKKIIIPVILITIASTLFVNAQSKGKPIATVKVEVFYFHPTERCPIDQAIEENTRATMKSDFSREIKAGTIKFQVLNTDDKANAQTVAKFNINVQALYIMKHDKEKEIKNDLTEFAFSCGQSNPLKFKTRLKDEIDKALK